MLDSNASTGLINNSLNSDLDGRYVFLLNEPLNLSSTTLTSSQNPSDVGQNVTFTATVSAGTPGAGTPTGSVAFYDGATLLATEPLNGDDQASFSTTSLAAATHTITANYSGDSNFLTSGATLSQQVSTPQASDASYTMLHDQVLIADGLLGDPASLQSDISDAAGNSLTTVLVTGPSDGTLTFNSDGTFVYAPNAGFVGSDSFQFQAQDAFGYSNTATVTINVTDQAPVASDTSYTVQQGQTLTADGQGTDPLTLQNFVSDADGDSLTTVLVSDPSNGTVSLNSDGSFVYTPTTDYVGTDSFQYQAFDGAEYSNTATVSINVTAAAPPLAGAASYTMLHDQTLTADGVGSDPASLQSVISDPEDNPLTTVLIAGPSNGSVTLNSNGSFVYTPNAGFVGTDSFLYQAYDGTAYSNTALVSIAVTDQAPVTQDGSYTLTEDQTFQVDATQGVLSSASDPDGDSLTSSIVSGPSNGSLSLNSDGSFSYTPNAGFTGADSFEYTASDGALDTAGWVTLIVQAPLVNAGPSQTTLVGTSVQLQGSIDAAGGATFPTIEWDFNYDGSTFIADPAGEGTLTPTYTWSDPGTYLVALQVTDPQGTTFQALTSVLVKPTDALLVNAGLDLTVTAGDSFSLSGSYTDNGASVSSSGIAWDTDYDGQTFNPVITGTLTPTVSYATAGSYEVALQVTDSAGNTDLSVLQVTVNPVAYVGPTADAGSNQTINAGATTTFSGSYTDPDGTVSLSNVAWDFNYDGSGLQCGRERYLDADVAGRRRSRNLHRGPASDRQQWPQQHRHAATDREQRGADGRCRRQRDGDGRQRRVVLGVVHRRGEQQRPGGLGLQLRWRYLQRRVCQQLDSAARLHHGGDVRGGLAGEQQLRGQRPGHVDGDRAVQQWSGGQCWTGSEC